MGSCGFLANHYPFILVTIIMPLASVAYIVLGHLYSAVRHGTLYFRGERLTAYSIVLIPIIVLLGTAFFKAAYDYTYITSVVGGRGPVGGAVPLYWQSISGEQDYERLLNITWCLAPYYFLAGLTLGLTPGIVLLRRVTESWILHLIPAVIGPIMFVYFEAAPVKKLYFALGFLKEHGLPLGVRPFDLVVWPVWEKHLLTGVGLGIALSVAAYIAARTRAPQYLGRLD